MTLEEKLYMFIKGLKTNIQISVSMQDTKTVELSKILASSADGILSHKRRSLPSGPFASHSSPFVARLEPMEIGAVVQRRHKLDPDEYERRRAGRLCFACGKAGHCAFEHAADGSPPAGSYVRSTPTGATGQEGTRGGRGFEWRRTKKEVTGRQRRQTKYLCLLHKAVYYLSDYLYPQVLTGQE
jgi:hypothetical protein